MDQRDLLPAIAALGDAVLAPGEPDEVIVAAVVACVAADRGQGDGSPAEADRLAAVGRLLQAAAERLTGAPRPAAGRASGADAAGTALGRLSGREAEVLDLVASGLASEQVARSLRVSCRTVHKHLEHIYAKLDVHNRTEAAGLWHHRPADRPAERPPGPSSAADEQPIPDP